MSLERLQSTFAAALLGEHALDARGFVGGGTREGLALYRSNLRAAREKALANAYPITRAIVGDEFFSRLARAYADAHPSTSGDLNAFGARLSEFIAAFGPTQRLRYLPDVADLEWAVHRGHAAADAEGLARERLASISAQELLGARFRLHPAVAWRTSAFPIATLWLAHQADSSIALPATLDCPQHALVVRPHWRVAVHASSGAEIASLAALRAGESMDAAIGSALAQDPEFDFPRTLVRWLDLCVLVAMRPSL
jgi:hypothetical protein